MDAVDGSLQAHKSDRQGLYLSVVVVVSFLRSLEYWSVSASQSFGKP